MIASAAPKASPTSASAIVFAYHNVGVRSLRVLLDAGVDVRLVVTHEDNPAETIWFASVADVAAAHGIACIKPTDPNADDVLARCRAAEPDFLFSFYYRQLLAAPLLALPRRGAFNLHGSLLPKYRGRAPVNWAILCGERETGATLHAMDVKPDHGAIVDQFAVPILCNDTAREVFDKVTLAAEIVVARALPGLVDGTATLITQQHLAGQYFGGRRPEDGRIPPAASARRIHDLVRAVAPPEYPGAFFDAQGHRIGVASTLSSAFATAAASASGPTATTTATASFAPAVSDRFRMFALDDQLWIEAADGMRVRVLAASVDGQPCDAAGFTSRFGEAGASPDA